MKPRAVSTDKPHFVGPTRAEVVLESREAFGALWKNLLKGGLFVECDPPRAIGLVVQVKLKGPKAEIELDGRIIHAIDGRLSKVYGQAPGVGLEFRAFRKELLGEVERYVAGELPRLGTAPVEAEPENDDDDLAGLGLSLDDLPVIDSSGGAPQSEAGSRADGDAPAKAHEEEEEEGEEEEETSGASELEIELSGDDDEDSDGDDGSELEIELSGSDDESEEDESDEEGSEADEDDFDELAEKLEEVEELAARFANGDLYEALEVSPEISDEGLARAVSALRNRLSVESSSKSARRIQQLEQEILEALAPVSDHAARLRFDFGHGHLRVQDRIAAAKGKKRALDELRAAWADAFEDKVRQADEAVAESLKLEATDLRQAFKIGREALELDPFNFDLRFRLSEWKKRITNQPKPAAPAPPPAAVHSIWGMLKAPSSGEDLVMTKPLELRAELSPLQALLGAFRQHADMTVLVGSFVFEIDAAGNIVRMTPPDGEGTLHELVRFGGLSQSDLDELLDEAGGAGQAEAIAVEKGKIYSESLSTGLRALLKRRAPEFLDQTGPWRTTDQLRAKALVKVSFDEISRAVFTTALRALPAGSSEAFFKDQLELAALPAPSAPGRLEKMQLEARELELLRSVRGTESLKQIHARSLLTKAHFYALTHWLVATSIWEVGQPKKKSEMEKILSVLKPR